MRRPGRKTAVFRRSASGGLPLGRPSGHRGGILPQNRDRPEPMSAGVARGVVPTIRPMLENLQQLAASAFMQRATLWLNHVLSSEEAAVQRLRPHAGRFIRLQMEGWPALLPPLPELMVLGELGQAVLDGRSDLGLDEIGMWLAARAGQQAWTSRRISPGCAVGWVGVRDT